MSSQQIYREVKNAILKGDIELTRNALLSFNPGIFQMKYDDYNNLLASFLKICVKSNGKKEMFLAILDVFNTEDDYIPIYSRIWILARIDNLTLQFVPKVLDYSAVSYLIDLGKYETFPQEGYLSVVPIDTAIRRVEAVFGEFDGNALINAREGIKDGNYVNGIALSFIENKLLSYYGKEIKTAAKPDYVEDLGLGDEDLLVKALKIVKSTNILTEKGYEIAVKLANEIPDDTIQLGTQEMPMRDYVYRNTVISTPYELRELVNMDLSCNNKSISYNPDNINKLEKLATVLIQILGPCNPFGDVDYGNDEMTMYDRMFICICYENGLEEDYGERASEEEVYIFSWFTGICDKCSQAIIKPWYAVRAPVLPGGGWCGCYCSWKCVKNDMTNISPDMESYIRRFEKQLNEYGVHDRTWV